MSNSKRVLNEMLVVRIGAIGVPAEGMGIVPVDIDLDTMDDVQIGQAMAAGFRAAHTQAVTEFGPKLSAAWAADPDRIRNGDGGEDTTP